MARQLDVGVESLHGDKDQSERTNSMRKFSKSADTAILVATDIASRGLDVKDIRTVINYDVAKNIETYVHRIGRTGTHSTFSDDFLGVLTHPSYHAQQGVWDWTEWYLELLTPC